MIVLVQSFYIVSYICIPSPFPQNVCCMLFRRQFGKLSPHSWRSDIRITCCGHMINLYTSMLSEGTMYLAMMFGAFKNATCLHLGKPNACRALARAIVLCTSPYLPCLLLMCNSDCVIKANVRYVGAGTQN